MNKMTYYHHAMSRSLGTIFIKVALLTVLLMSVQLAARAQSPSISQDTITWEVDQLTDQAQNVTESFQCKFVTSVEGIRWLQRNDEQVNDLAVLGTTGQWTNLSADGFYEFEITFQNRTGQLRFERTGSNVQIRMTFMDGGTNIMPYVFRVDNFYKN